MVQLSWKLQSNEKQKKISFELQKMPLTFIKQEYQSKFQKLRKEFKQKIQNAQKIQYASQSLKLTIKNQQNQINIMTFKQKQAESAFVRLKQDYNTGLDQRQKLNKQLQDKQTMIQYQKGKNLQNNQKITKLNSQLSSFKEKYQQIRKKISNDQKSVDGLQQVVRQCKHQIQLLKQKNRIEQNRYDTLSAQKKLQTNEIERLQQLLINHRQSQEQRKSQLIKLQKDFAQERLKFEQKVQKLEYKAFLTTIPINKIQNQGVQILQKQVNSLKKQLTQKNFRIQSLKNDSEEIYLQYKRLSQKMHKYRQQNNLQEVQSVQHQIKLYSVVSIL